MTSIGGGEPEIALNWAERGVIIPATLYPSDVRGGIPHHHCALLVDRALHDYWLWAADGSCGWIVGTHVVDFNVAVTRPITDPVRLAVHLWLQCGAESRATFGFRILSKDFEIEFAAGQQVFEAVAAGAASVRAFDDDDWELVEPFMPESALLSSITA